MTHKEFKTLRVVVEVPVRGSFNSKDLRWVVEQACSRGLHDLTARIRAHSKVYSVGRVRILQYNRHLAATEKQEDSNG